MNRLRLIYILLIIILLLLPLVLTAIDIKFNIKLYADDNTEIPKFEGNIIQFAKQYKNYFRSNYAGKNLFISIYSNLRLTGLKESPLPNRILLGTDNFLYYCEKEDGNPIVDYQGYIQLTEDDLESIYFSIKNFYEWLKQKKILFYLIVVPDKQSIYYDKLPEKIKKIDRTSADQIIDYLTKKGIPVIDLRQPLLEAKSLSNLDIYFKTDTHWNSLGAYIAYRSIIKNLLKYNIKIKPINIDIQIIDEKQIIKHGGTGELYVMMKLKNDPYIYDIALEHPTSYTIEYPEGEKPYPKIIITKSNKSNLEVVIYRDSFFQSLIPYISNNFKYAYYLWDYLHISKKIKKSIIEEINPDIVILESAERYLQSYKNIK